MGFVVGASKRKATSSRESAQICQKRTAGNKAGSSSSSPMEVDDEDDEQDTTPFAVQQ